MPKAKCLVKVLFFGESMTILYLPSCVDRNAIHASYDTAPFIFIDKGKL